MIPQSIPQETVACYTLFYKSVAMREKSVALIPQLCSKGKVCISYSEVVPSVTSYVRPVDQLNIGRW